MLHDTTFYARRNFSSEIENIFFDILLPKTKPIDFNNQEVYILGNLNINLLNTKKHLPNGIKRYREFCSLHGLRQLINAPKLIDQSSSSLLDHVLTNSPNRVSQAGVVDVSLSHHQLIYCTRKVTQARFNRHKYIKTMSLRDYSKDLYLEEMGKVNFPNYSNFNDVNDAYSDFIGKVTSVVYKIAPVKEIHVKNNTQDWFDKIMHEAIRTCEKPFAKFKNSKCQDDHETYKVARNNVQRMIKSKKKNFVLDELSQNIGKPKELWMSLKSLGLPSKQKLTSSPLP